MPARTDPVVGAGLKEEDNADEQTTILPDFGGHRARLEDNGFTYGVAYVGEVIGNTAGGADHGAIYEGLLRVDLELDTEKVGAWSGGTFHVSSLAPHGESLSKNGIGELFTVSNIDAPHDVRLFELWYQHQIVPDRLSLRLGQLAADEEFSGTERGGAFITSACGWIPIISVNAPAPAYPAATPGARLELTLDGGWTVRAAVYNGDPTPVDDAGESENEHGTNISWRDALVLFEAQWGWNAGDAASGLPGTVKVGGWHHTGRFDDLRFDDSGLSLANPASSGQPESHRGTSGGYLAVEQQITREKEESADEGLGVFARFGGAPGDRNLLEWYAEAGTTYTGLIPGRDKDVAGIACVFGRISDHARDLVDDANQVTGANDPLPDYELALEGTYRMEVHPGFAVQPVVSYLIHPGGTQGHDALVLALRASLDF